MCPRARHTHSQVQVALSFNATLSPTCDRGARMSLGFNYFVNILVIYIQDRCMMIMMFILPSRTQSRLWEPTQL